MRLPLSGLRVLTMEQFGAGPFGSMYLADMGAEVIKIENPATGGDASRSMGPNYLGEHDSEYFQSLNIYKKSMTLNLKTAQGREVLARLAAVSDVVMNNMRGDQPGKLGLDYATLGPHNPRLICAHLSAYGRDNDRTGWPGYDYLMQAEAGFFSVTGEPGTPPARFGLSVVDFLTGITTAFAVVAALFDAFQHFHIRRFTITTGLVNDIQSSADRRSLDADLMVITQPRGCGRVDVGIVRTFVDVIVIGGGGQFLNLELVENSFGRLDFRI